MVFFSVKAAAAQNIIETENSIKYLRNMQKQFMKKPVFYFKVAKKNVQLYMS